jgi:branched-chain amino acid transport system permease protein
MLWQLLVSGLAVGSIYALVAVGYSLTFLPTRIVNFAQGDLTVLCSLIGYTSFVSLGLPLPTAAATAMAAGGLSSLLAERLAVRRFLQRPEMATWVVSTLGLGLVIRYSAVALWGKSPLAFPDPLSGASIRLLGTGVYLSEILALAVALTIAVALSLLMTRTKFGKALRCLAVDPSTAALMGVPVSRSVAMAFALCGITTGAAGILVAPLINVTPEMGAVLGLKGFAAAAMGGMANPLGAAVGGLMLGTAEVVFAGVLWPGFHDIFAFLVLMAVLLIRPKGLTGPAQERIV